MQEKTIAEIAQEQLESVRPHFRKFEVDDVPGAMEPGRYRIVSDGDLEQATQHGSRVVRVLDRTVLHEQWVEKERNNSGGYGRERYHEKEMQWGPGQVFLIFTPVTAKEREEEMTRARNEVVAANGRAFEAERKFAALEKTHTQKGEEHKASLENAMAIGTRARSRADTAEDRMRRMEIDLGKLRKAIGDVQMNRILAEQT